MKSLFKSLKALPVEHQVALLFNTLGTPTNSAPFTPNAQGRILYFDFVRDTLKTRLAVLEANPLARFNDAQSFIGSFQGDELFPYLKDGVPTLGLGINLNTLEQFYGRPFTADEARSLLDQQRERAIVTPRNLPL